MIFHRTWSYLYSYCYFSAWKIISCKKILHLLKLHDDFSLGLIVLCSLLSDLNFQTHLIYQFIYFILQETKATAGLLGQGCQDMDSSISKISLVSFKKKKKERKCTIMYEVLASVKYGCCPAYQNFYIWLVWAFVLQPCETFY